MFETMGSSAWKLSFPRAVVRHGSFEASVDLRHPQLGLHRASIGRQQLQQLQVLGVDVAAAQASVADYCQCDCDLMAVYGETDDRPIQVDLRWRVLRLPELPAVQVGFELVSSVRTSALQCSAVLRSCSVVPAGEMYVLADHGKRLEQLHDREQEFDAQSPVVGLVFRLPHADLYYLEVVHPNDRVAVTVEEAAHVPGAVRVTSTLLSALLEKGVIFRSRAQAALVDGAGLEATCSRFFQRFVAADPPLGA